MDYITNALKLGINIISIDNAPIHFKGIVISKFYDFQYNLVYSILK